MIPFLTGDRGSQGLRGQVQNCRPEIRLEPQSEEEGQRAREIGFPRLRPVGQTPRKAQEISGIGGRRRIGGRESGTGGGESGVGGGESGVGGGNSNEESKGRRRSSRQGERKAQRKHRKAGLRTERKTERQTKVGRRKRRKAGLCSERKTERKTKEVGMIADDRLLQR